MTKRIKPKPGCSLGVSNAVSQTTLVDKEVYPIVQDCEKKLKKVAKEHNLKIDGLIWVWSCR